MAEFAYFKHKITGNVSKLPARYGALFKDVLEEVDASEHNCVDCGVPPVEEPEAEPEIRILPLEEPAPRKRTRKVQPRTDAVE